MTILQLRTLLSDYLEGTISPEGYERLSEAAATCSQEAWWEMVAPFIRDIVTHEEFNAQEWEPVISAILTKDSLNTSNKDFKSEISIIPANPISRNHGIHFLKTSWFRYAAAILIMLGVGSYLWFNNTTPNPVNQKNPLDPSSDNHNKAILTLSNGQQIILDSTQGNIVQQGKLTVVNLAGKLKYEGVGTTTEYNILSTPKGGQYQVVLPDGSKVWLNAASSIKFPTAFTGSQRKVEMTGEAYMEVAKNPKQSFVVKANGTEVQVLGTSFNVNAYKDEEATKTTLLEGSVKIGNNILKPGQAYMNGKVMATNVEQDIAWKEGIFNFNHLPLKEAMKQLARWYDLKIVYEKEPPPFYFYGEMGRDLSLNEVLKILSGLGVNFKMIEEKKLIVTIK